MKKETGMGFRKVSCGLIFPSIRLSRFPLPVFLVSLLLLAPLKLPQIWGLSEAWAGEEPVRPTYADIGQALRNGKSQFYIWYRGQIADQPIRDAMQQYLTGVIIPELSRTLEKDCSQVIGWEFGGEGGAIDVIYRRLGNVYENLSNPWSIGPQGRNYSNDVTALEKFQTCLAGHPARDSVTMGIRDALDLRIVNGKYVRGGSFYIFPQPTPNETLAKRSPVNVKLSFPPQGSSLQLLHDADSAHGAASGIGIFPLSVDQAAKAYEFDAKNRDELHFREMKRFTGFCDPRWGAANCLKWKGVQHKFFHCWTAAEEKGNWRDARNCDSDHQLAHICTNYWNPEVDVRFSVPGVDEHDWPIMNCPAALEKLGG